MYWQAVQQREAYIAELDSRAEVLRPLARSVATKRRHLRMLQNQVARNATVLELLGNITRLAPKEKLNITRFTYDRVDGIELSGRALQAESFDQMIDDLRGKGSETFSLFAQAQELYRTRSRERGREAWDFAITIPFLEEGETGNE